MASDLARALTIAGSDSGGGAGIQADLKTFGAHRVYGMSVVTSVTAQNTVAVTAVHPVPVDVVRAQIDAVFSDIGVDAAKIGMLGTAETVREVADGLARHSGPPVVLDPVMVAKSGDRLLRPDGVEALLEDLFPKATLVTPNLPEAGVLASMPADSRAEDLAHALADKGASAVLIKGGHSQEPGGEIEDLLFDNGRVSRFRHRRISTTSTHGTGCTLSAAIAARLARGEDLGTAVEGGIAYLQRAIETAVPLGGGHGPVNHFAAVEPLGEGQAKDS